MLSLPPDLARKRIARLKEAAELSGQSVDSLKRNHAAKIIKIGKRNLGMRVEDALMLNGGND